MQVTGLPERLLNKSASVRGFFLPHQWRHYGAHFSRLLSAWQAGRLQAAVDSKPFRRAPGPRSHVGRGALAVSGAGSDRQLCHAAVRTGMPVSSTAGARGSCLPGYPVVLSCAEAAGVQGPPLCGRRCGVPPHRRQHGQGGRAAGRGLASCSSVQPVAVQHSCLLAQCGASVEQ